MGYRTLYGGELTITPPLTASEHDRLLELCRLDNPRAKDVFASTTKATDEDRAVLGHRLPWDVLFYEWTIGPCEKTDDHEPGDCWIVRPPDSEMGGGAADVPDDLAFLHRWLLVNGHQLDGELSWSGSGDGDTGTIYVDPLHGVEAVEDIHDNPGPSWTRSAAELTPIPPDITKLMRKLERAMDGDSGDAETDAAFELLEALKELPVDIPFSPSPGCGHSSQYAYTEDGGKHIVCLLCEREENRILDDTARAVYRQIAGGDDDRKTYVIEFLYADNNQLYQTFARLTDEERDRVEIYLNRLDLNGDITLAGSSYLCEWSSIKPHLSLEGLVKEFEENTAFDGPREDGIKLEVSDVDAKN